MFQRSFEKVYKVVQDIFKGISRKFQESFKEDGRLCHGKIEWCFNGVLIGVQVYLKEVQRMFKGRVTGVL